MKNQHRILLTENIHSTAKVQLENDGHHVELINYSPSSDELMSLLKNYDVIGIRSKTKLTSKILEHNSHLIAIGCFCIGTNQVDLISANGLGIPVFNAPHSNTRSVAELVIAEIISLARQLADRSQKAHKGIWDKSATGSMEVRGKNLGIVGYGHIGSQVSVLAEAMGLNVYFYDVSKKLPLGNAKMVSTLDELLKISDFMTLHVPELPETKNMIGHKQLNLMKRGSYLINASRGTVVVIEDLVTALKSGHIAGCAIDVFPKEPASNEDRFSSPLQELPNVIITPHIGGSTQEAQVAIGDEVAESFKKFLKAGTSNGAVNFPQMEVQPKQKSKRLLNVHRNEPGALSQINSIISKAGVNIEGQYLSTDDKIGYLMMDVQAENIDPLLVEISKLPISIKTRVV
jgi:D-3-phosphoglycerate dehydrogenase / 2-oxoglutarate reductase